LGRPPRALLVLALAALLAAPVTPASAVVRTPAAQLQAPDAGPNDPIREDGILGLAVLQSPRSGKVCAGASFPIGLRISNVSPGVEVPIPVAEAQVSVEDDQGLVREELTNGAGFIRFNWPANKDGQLRLTVTAKKQFYQPAAPVKLTVQVEPCQFGLRVSFHEEYSIVSEWVFVVGDRVDWRGTLRAKPGQGEDAASDIELAGGSGSYEFYCSDKIQAPLHWSIDPPVSGTWDMRVTGTLSQGTLRLEIGAAGETHPPVALFKLTDTTGQYQINYKPPAPMSNGNGLFLELNHLNQVSFPASGGVVNLDSGMSNFLYTDTRTIYSLSIMLFPLKDLGASVPGKTAFAGALP
jgi:hypothetical protein